MSSAKVFVTLNVHAKGYILQINTSASYPPILITHYTNSVFTTTFRHIRSLLRCALVFVRGACGLYTVHGTTEAVYVVKVYYSRMPRRSPAGQWHRRGGSRGIERMLSFFKQARPTQTLLHEASMTLGKGGVTPSRIRAVHAQKRSVNDLSVSAA